MNGTNHLPMLAEVRHVRSNPTSRVALPASRRLTLRKRGAGLAGPPLVDCLLSPRPRFLPIRPRMSPLRLGLATLRSNRNWRQFGRANVMTEDNLHLIRTVVATVRWRHDTGLPLRFQPRVTARQFASSLKDSNRQSQIPCRRDTGAMQAPGYRGSL